MEDINGIAEFALKQAEKYGTTYAEVRVEKSEGEGFVTKNSIIEASSFAKTKGFGMRFIVNGCMGFFSTNNFEKNLVKNLLKKSINTTKHSAKLKEPIHMLKENFAEHHDHVKQKKSFFDIPTEKKIELLNEIEQSAKEIEKKRVALSTYFSLSVDETEKLFINSEGAKIHSIIPKVNFFYFLTLKKGNLTNQRFWQYGKSSGWEGIESFKLPELMKEETNALYHNMKHGIKPPKGEVDVVAAPQVVGIMVHESGGHPYEADRIFGREAAQAGESFITKEMIGYKIGNECVNIADDPTIENSFGYYLYDDEGVKARRKYLVKEGYINEFLHNRETASQMNITSNGSSRASNYDREAIVRMSNTFILPGEYKEEELIEDIKLGVYMKNFMEWNIDDKRLNQKYVGSECYLIKNGKIENPVKIPKIEIDTTSLYHKIDAVANNIEYHAGTCGKAEPMQAIPVWFGGPSIRLRGIKVV